MQTAFNILTVLLPSLVIYQIRHSVLFARMEKCWIAKYSLSLKKANVSLVFWFLTFYNIMLICWFVSGLLQISYMGAFGCAISIQQALQYWKKMSPSFYIIFLFDRLTVFFFLTVFNMEYFFNVDYAENIFWKSTFMFSVQFFLITFTV